jgi:hypothetical protein
VYLCLDSRKNYPSRETEQVVLENTLLQGDHKIENIFEKNNKNIIILIIVVTIKKFTNISLRVASIEKSL